MVKFGEYLLSNQVNEWRKKYVDYELLKKHLKRLAQRLELREQSKAAKAKLLQRRTSDGKIEEDKEEAEAPQKPGSKRGTKVLDKLDASQFHRKSPVNNNAVEALIKAAAYPEAYSSTRAVNKMMGSEAIPLEHWEDLADGAPGPKEEQVFLIQLQLELEKVNAFFREQERYFLGQVNRLISQANLLDPGMQSFKAAKVALRQGIRELHRGLELLKNFRILNYTAFVKITKKHDKLSTLQVSERILPLVIRAPFFSSPSLAKMRDKVEEVYIEVFSDGDRSKGLDSLKNQAASIPSYVIFELGFMTGMLLALVVVLVFIARNIPDVESSSFFFAPFPVFRVFALIVLHIFLWGIDVLIFTKIRVNYRFILEASTRNTLTASLLMRVALVSLCLWLFFMCLYLFGYSEGGTNSQGEFTSSFSGSGYIHAAMFGMLVVVSLWPEKRFFYATRRFFWKGVFRVLTAPFFFVNFFDFFLADQLNSQVRSILDLPYAICFYTSPAHFLDNEASSCRDLVENLSWLALIPAWARFAQCWRRYIDTKDKWHIANAGKYLSSMLTTTFSIVSKSDDSFRAVWYVFAIIATMYAYAWDIRKDWGLLERDDNGNIRSDLLREERLIPYKAFYYVAAISNLFLRVAWVLTISPESLGLTFHKDLLLLLIGVLEVYRRGQWNILRLENEHANNCGNFRAVKQIPVVIDFADDDDDKAEDEHKESTELATIKPMKPTVKRFTDLGDDVDDEVKHDKGDSGGASAEPQPPNSAERKEQHDDFEQQTTKQTTAAHSDQQLLQQHERLLPFSPESSADIVGVLDSAVGDLGITQRKIKRVIRSMQTQTSSPSLGVHHDDDAADAKHNNSAKDK